jgi:hypothetical protein
MHRDEEVSPLLSPLSFGHTTLIRSRAVSPSV